MQGEWPFSSKSASHPRLIKYLLSARVSLALLPLGVSVTVLLKVGAFPELN